MTTEQTIFNPGTFTDSFGVTYEAQPTANRYHCYGCAFFHQGKRVLGPDACNASNPCEPWDRHDMQDIIWVKK